MSTGNSKDFESSNLQWLRQPRFGSDRIIIAQKTILDGPLLPTYSQTMHGYSGPIRTSLIAGGIGAMLLVGCRQSPQTQTGQAVALHSKDADGNDVTFYVKPGSIVFNGTNFSSSNVTMHAIYPKLLIPEPDLVSLTNAVLSFTNEPVLRIDQYDSDPVRVFVLTGTNRLHCHSYPFELTPSGWQYRPSNP